MTTRPKTMLELLNASTGKKTRLQCRGRANDVGVDGVLLEVGDDIIHVETDHYIQVYRISEIRWVSFEKDGPTTS